MRPITASSAARSSTWSRLSRVSRTDANPMGLRRLAPPKITCSILPEARSWRELVSPSTQRTASDRLDFPEPLGPTMPVTPASNRIFTLSGKLLKPWISSCFNIICKRSFSAAVHRSFSTPSSFSASRAAHCSAAFLLRPSPRATRSELKRTATTKCLSWSGPVSCSTT